MAEGQKKTILLVEDEALIAMDEAATLRGHGYEVLTAASGEEAVELVRSGAVIDLVLMDIDLGSGMDGAEAAEIILGETNTPLVFLSSHTEPETVAKTEGITSFGYIVKNSGDTVLTASINMAFRLWESEQKFRTAFDNVSAGMVLTSPEGRLLRVNDAFADMLGYEPSEIQSLKFSALTHPDELHKSLKYMKAALEGELEKVTFSKRYIHKDGSAVWTKIDTMLMRDRLGKPMHFVTHVQDITELRLSEAALRESKDRLTSIFKAVPAGIGVVRGTDRTLMEVNEKMCGMTGYTREELIGKSARVLYPSDEDYDYVGSEKYRQIAEQGTGAVETRWKKKDGSVINILLASTPIHAEDISLGVTFSAMDITQQQITRDTLKEKTRLLENITDNMLDLVALTDIEGNFQYVGKSHEILGYDLDYLIGKNMLDFAHPDDLPEVAERFTNSISKQQDGRAEYRIKCFDGSFIWLETFGKILKDAEGNEPQVIFTSRNVTERKEAEKALEYEGYLLHSLMDNFPGTIYFKDLESRFVRINRAHAKLFGLDDPAEAVGKTDFDFFSPKHAERAYRDEQEIIRTGETISKEEKESWTDKPGKWTLTTKMPLKDVDERIIGTFGVTIDLTQQKRAESQIEALLAGKELVLKEVQHRIKNTMNTMVSLLSLQAANVEDEKAAAALNDAQSRFRSMEVLYDQLYKTDAHESAPIKEYLEQLIEKAADLFPAGETAEISAEIDDFLIDSKTLSTLGMIVNELVTNAMKYAFGDCEGARLLIKLNRDSGLVKLVIEDNGPGFPAEQSAHNGFGLKMVQALSAQIGGSVGIETRNGTRVSIQFPEPDFKTK